MKTLRTYPIRSNTSCALISTRKSRRSFTIIIAHVLPIVFARMIIMSSPIKSCPSDPAPTFILREFLDDVLLPVTVNESHLRRLTESLALLCIRPCPYIVVFVQRCMKTIDVTWPWSSFALHHVNCRSFFSQKHAIVKPLLEKQRNQTKHRRHEQLSPGVQLILHVEIGWKSRG